MKWYLNVDDTINNFFIILHATFISAHSLMYAKFCCDIEARSSGFISYISSRFTSRQYQPPVAVTASQRHAFYVTYFTSISSLIYYASIASLLAELS